MSFRNGAQVGADAREGSTGKGGSITVNAAGNVYIGGENSSGYPSVLSSGAFGEGDGGSITVTAAGLSLDEGGIIQASTTGQGTGRELSTSRRRKLHATGGDHFCRHFWRG